MQLSKRGKEPVEQPLFRVSETIAPHSPPSTHPRRILPKSPPPTPQPRRILAEPAPNPHRITTHASRNHGRTLAARSISAPPVPLAESGIPLRYSRATSAAGYETHSRCGCPPLVSTARILEDRPAPPTTSRKTDMPNHPKTSPPRQPAEPCGNGKTRPSRLSRKPRRTEPRKARCVSRQAPDGFTPYSVRPLAPQSGRSATARPNPISASQRPGHARRCRAPPNRSMRSRFRRILPRPLRPPQAAAGKRP